MPLSIIQEDITNMKTDAIVNAADTYFSGKWQVDNATKRACKERNMSKSKIQFTNLVCI